MSATKITEDPTTLEEVKSNVKQLEEMLDSLEEIIQENHQELLEKLDDLKEGGRGFHTFES